MSANQILPISSNERIDLLDALRGLAICGILFGNMQWFSGYGMMPPAVAEQSATLADQITHFLVHFFIEGKFYSIFSFLFGFGFALQIARSEERGDFKARLFKRRLFWLLVIGLLHAYLLWAGDILSIYAVTGFLLLLFRRKSDAALLKWAFWLLVVPVLFYILLYVLFVSFAPAGAGMPPDAASQIVNWERQIRAVSESGYWQIISQYNLQYILGRYAGLIAEMRIPKLLAMFLLGYYAYRRGFFQNLPVHGELIRRVMKYALVFGLIGNALLSAVLWINPLFPPSLVGIAGTIGYGIGVPSMALFFIALASILWQKAGWRRILAVLAPVGRMALTNYLLQTVICVLIFYGFGLGLFGKIGAAAATLLAFGIFLFQIALSTIWLKYFQYGWFEWLWRQLTYGKRLPLTRQARQIDSAQPSLGP
jgi:uncharacterized protein